MQPEPAIIALSGDLWSMRSGISFASCSSKASFSENYERFTEGRLLFTPGTVKTFVGPRHSRVVSFRTKIALKVEICYLRKRDHKISPILDKYIYHPFHQLNMAPLYYLAVYNLCQQHPNHWAHNIKHQVYILH